MATVTGKTAEAMDAIADASIVTGAVDGSGHLILTTHGGDDVDAGSVVGPTGATGATGSTGSTGATGPTGPSGAVPGIINMWGTGSAPTGWLLCDGSAVSRTSFAALFAVIGTTFGTGDGSTTFNIPNMQGKYARMDTAALGGTGGAASHDHDLVGGTPTGIAQITIITGPGPNTQINRVTGQPTYTANFQATTGSSNTTSESNPITSGALLSGHTASSSNLPPYLNLNFIIKT
jgi:microcystin-dependent protein